MRAKKILQILTVYEEILRDYAVEEVTSKKPDKHEIDKRNAAYSAICDINKILNIINMPRTRRKELEHGREE